LVLQMTLRILLSLFLVAQLSIGWAASPVIGVAIAQGSLRVDDSRVIGNGTLFEGTTVETGDTSSQLRLNDGVEMRLASGSRGRIYRDRMILDRGAGQVENAGRFTIEAKGLHILVEGPNAAGRVAVKDDHLVQVAALRGHFRVLTADGVTLAALPAGKALEFEAQQAGASAPWSMSGCVLNEGGRFLLRDQTTGVTVELRGAGLASSAGRTVAVTGVVVPSAQPAEGASQVIQVSTVRQLEDHCASLPSASKPSAPKATTSAAMTGAKKAVIAGVVVAAAGAGAGIGLTRGGGEPETISR
jgi:hypothetical protein